MVRCAAVESQAFDRAHLKADAPAIMIGAWRGDDRSQIKTIEFADSAESVGDALLFGLELLWVTDMLPSAAAAVADVGAGRGLSQRRWFDDFYDFTEGIALFRFDNPRDQAVARSAMGNHDRLAFQAANAVRAVGKPVDI